jgi:hypothetical protein
MPGRRRNLLVSARPANRRQQPPSVLGGRGEKGGVTAWCTRQHIPRVWVQGGRGRRFLGRRFDPTHFFVRVVGKVHTPLAVCACVPRVATPAPPWAGTAIQSLAACNGSGLGGRGSGCRAVRGAPGAAKGKGPSLHTGVGFSNPRGLSRSADPAPHPARRAPIPTLQPCLPSPRLAPLPRRRPPRLRSTPRAPQAPAPALAPALVPVRVSPATPSAPEPEPNPCRYPRSTEQCPALPVNLLQPTCLSRM